MDSMRGAQPAVPLKLLIFLRGYARIGWVTSTAALDLLFTERLRRAVWNTEYVVSQDKQVLGGPASTNLERVTPKYDSDKAGF